jgi:hypothetical protein
MHDFGVATELLKAGRSIKREGSLHTHSSFFLKNVDGVPCLFERLRRGTLSEIVERPAVFGWDDVIATNWQVVESSSTGR